MTRWEGKKVTIFGLGKSGAAAARRLVPLKSQVFISEKLPLDRIDPALVEEMKKLGVGLEFGGHTPKAIESAELIVMSPGIHLDLPEIIEAHTKNIPVISEIELAYRFLSKPIIAVTGTNGKTTTATLIGEFLKAAGKKVAVAGNIGDPLIEVDDKDLEFIVVEISSYQLETIITFRPWISLILNLTEDHIERHKTMESYGRAKARIFMNQSKTDYVIYNADDKLVSALVTGSDAKLVPFCKENAFLKLSDMKIPGEHNLENALAASQAALICGVEGKAIEQVLKDFPGVEHRIEFVVDKKGVKFYNDSKGTNPDSTIVALKALSTGPKNIILILGGRDKGGNLSDLMSLVSDTVKQVILIGEAADRFKQALHKEKYQETVLAQDLGEAVTTAFKNAKSGDIVLLSPACASFDMFRNYEERGKRFKELAVNLAG